MRRTKEERSTHRTVMRKTNSLQPASRKKAWFCTLGALLTEMSETIVPSAIECNLHRPKSTNVSSQSPRVWAVVWIEVLHAKKASLFFLVFCFCNYVSCILLGSFQALELFVLAAICRCARSSGWATSFQSRMHCIRRNSYFVVGPPPNPAFMRETSTGFMWQSSNHFYHAFIPHMQNSVPRIRPTHRTYEHLIIRRTRKPNFGCTRAQPRNTRRHDRHNWVCFWQMSAQNISKHFIGKTGATRSI